MSETPKGGHPYRDVVTIIEEASKRPTLAQFAGMEAPVVELKHALDDGVQIVVLVKLERAWLANRLRDIESNARFMREVATPLTVALGAAAASLLSYAVIGSLAKLHHGSFFAAVAITIGVWCAFFANKTRRWGRIADDIDGVAKDVRAFCRTMEIVPQKILEENAARRMDEAYRTLVREEVERAAQSIRAERAAQADPGATQIERTDTRVDLPGPPSETPADESSIEKDRIVEPVRKRKQERP